MLKTLLLSVRQARIFQDKQVNVIVIHFLFTVTIFLGLGLLLNKMPDRNSDLVFWAVVVLFLALGWLHIRMLYAKHDWAGRNSFLMETLFTLTVGLIGSVSFLSVITNGDYEDYYLPFLVAMGAFLIPFVLDRAILERERRPRQERPGWRITSLEEVKGLISMGPRTTEKNRYVRLIFKPDQFGYLPREILVPVSPKAEQEALGKLLKAAILHHNVRKQPENPVEVCYNAALLENEGAYTASEDEPEELKESQAKKNIKPFVWYFRRPGIRLLRSAYLDPCHSISGNKLRFYYSEEKGDRFLIHGYFTDVVIIRKTSKNQ